MKIIKLTRGKETMVDDDIYELIKDQKWHCTSEDYAIRNLPIEYRQEQKKIRLHQLVLGFPDSIIDHIDGNKLNNQRKNLRLCNESQNRMNSRLSKNNSTGYRGVWKTINNNFTARVKCCGKDYYLGRFKTAILAAKAYDKKIKELFGEFAKTNFKCKNYTTK